MRRSSRPRTLGGQQDPADRLKTRAVCLVKGCEFGGVHIKHRREPTLAIKNGDNDLGIRPAVARNVTGECMDVIDQRGLTRGRDRTTDTFAERDTQATQRPLIGSNDQFIGFQRINDIETRPEKPGPERLSQKAGGGRLARWQIGFARYHGLNL